MSVRAVILGVLLALAIASLSYFNDQVMRQTFLIGNFLPVSVFGVVVLLTLTLNPLLGRVRRGWALRAGELMLIAALGLSACAWPGSGLYRTFVTALAVPADLARNKTGWNAAAVMSYVPGGSPLLGDAHLRGLSPRDAPDGRPLAEALRDPDAPPAAAAVWQRLNDEQRDVLGELATAQTVRGDDRARAVEALNDVLRQTGWVQRLPGISLPNETLRWLERRDAAEAELTGVLEELGRVSRDQAAGQDGLVGRVAALRAQSRYLKDTAAQEGQIYHAERMANRHALAAALPGYILPPPRGSGVLPAAGRADPWVTDGVVVPAPPGAAWPVDTMPWSAWWPVINRWLGLTLFLGLAVVCLSVIVHPQWSRRELLPYPIVAFLREAVTPRNATNAETEKSTRHSTFEFRHSALPAVAFNKLFWLGLGAMVVLHLVNGLHAWFDAMPQVRMNFDLNPLRELFPNAAEVPTTRTVFTPRLYPSVIAFTFFLTLSVGFSLSASTFLWLAMGAAVIASGAAFGANYYDGRESNLLRFGAYAGMVLMILYTGRRHFASVALGAAGVPVSRAETPRACIWAMRLLVILIVLAVWWLRQMGLGAGWAAVFIAMAMGLWLVMARIVAETGCFYLQAGWLPVSIVAALVGSDAMGPTGAILFGLASLLIVGDQREALMPFVTHALKLADPAQQHPDHREDQENQEHSERSQLLGGTDGPMRAHAMPQRAGMRLGRPALAIASVVVLSLLVSGAVAFVLQYRLGINTTDRWATEWFPQMPWNDLTRRVQDLSADGTLTASAWDPITARLARATAEPGAWGWLLVGGALVIGCASARLRLAWWPLHPVLFLVWGTTPMERFAWSLVIGWMIKASVVKLGGAAGYRAAKPLMVGVIAGELLAALGWTVVGTVYYLITGTTPVSYTILPQ